MNCSATEHRDRVLHLVAGARSADSLPVLSIPLAEAAGWVLARDVVAPVAVPGFDHAAMDGFAVRAVDVGAVPVTLPVVGVVAAGSAGAPVGAGQAVRIMTGAALPEGADLVVPFEWTSSSGGSVEVLRTAPAGANLRRAGEDVAAGSVALAAGQPLTAGAVGLLASMGVAEVEVLASPRVALLATGAELVSGEVADSNSAALAACVDRAGAVAVVCEPVGDDPAAFRLALAEAALGAELVVTTGGVSAGDHDVVKAALSGEPDFWFGPVDVKPGRPQGCGVVVSPDGRRVPVVCLPGTPVAALASWHLFVAPALRALAGLPAAPVAHAPLASVVDAGDRTVALPGRLVDGAVEVLRGHAGHSQRLLASADVLVVVPPLRRELASGELVEVVALS